MAIPLPIEEAEEFMKVAKEEFPAGITAKQFVFCLQEVSADITIAELIDGLKDWSEENDPD